MPTSTVTLVTAPACHFCADARDTLAELARDHPLDVEIVEVHSDRGAALVAAHRPAMLPLALLDGAFFSAGRLPRRKLTALLATRATAGAA
jgi:glutaredoxin